jgi:hypothetical protein
MHPQKGAAGHKSELVYSREYREDPLSRASLQTKE